MVFDKHHEAYQMRIEDQAILMDRMNHSLGYYIAYAVNEPKKYPEEPLSSKKEKKDMTQDEMIEVVKSITSALDGKIR